MAYTYTAWSVVFGEQPSATKWNIIGTNMASFDERIGSNFSSGTDSPIWWEELGRTTLGSAGDTISVTGLGARKYVAITANLTATGGNINALVRFNNDSGNNYARRVSDNGAADATATSASSIGCIDAVADGPVNVWMYFVNVAAQEKIAYFQGHRRGTAGAGNAPARRDGLGKWANTADQVTRVDLVNDSTGDFAIGSSVVVRGHD